MDEPKLTAEPPSELYTVGDLEPINGQFIEMDYTGQLVAGRYRVQRHIGSGGMADVYRARDERLCRDVAVKFLKPRLASEEWCARMFQEARASAAIDHPHLLRVTDVGRVGPSIYLAMDLLHGASLETVLRAQPLYRLSWRCALELILPALGAFQAAHDQGFIHRDIKPDNLFLHRRSGEEHLIVLDLGIVKRMPAAPPESLRLPATATGYILGTPAYMSPEQAGGVALDARTDIYSLGITLYRMITGRLPFPASPGEPYVVLAKHLYELPPPFSAAAAAPFDCPGAVEQVVLRALAKQPDQRYTSVQALAAALRACLDPGLEYASTPLLPRLTALKIGAPVHSVGPKTPPRVHFRTFGQLSVLGVITAGLVAWRGSAVADRPASRIVLHDEPAVASVPSHRRIATRNLDLSPAPALTSTPLPATAVVPDKGLRRIRKALGGAIEEVRRCVDLHGDPDARGFAVEVTVSAEGVMKDVLSADGDITLVDNCIRKALMRIRCEPGPEGKFRHTFRLTGERP